MCGKEKNKCKAYSLLDNLSIYPGIINNAMWLVAQFVLKFSYFSSRIDSNFAKVDVGSAKFLVGI